MRVRIWQDPARGYQYSIVIIQDDNLAFYNFATGKWDENPVLGRYTTEFDEQHIFTLPEPLFQALAKEVKQLEFIPDPKGDYLQGELAATKIHLDDMRKLVFEGEHEQNHDQRPT